MASSPSNQVADLNELRRVLRDHEPPLFGLIVPSADAHMGEYVAERDCRRAFVSGFTGSLGDALVTQTEALVWADGRYHLQADQQVDPRSWTVMKAGLEAVPTLEEWLASHAKGVTIGVDPQLVSRTAFLSLQGKLAPLGSQLVPTAGNLVDAVWRDRPAESCGPVIIQGLELSGQPVGEKVAAVREALAKAGAFAVVVSALDEIAWLLNVRGGDVAFNPVVRSYLVVSTGAVLWYVDQQARFEGEHRAELLSHVADNGITLRAYGDLFADLSSPDSPLFAPLFSSPLFSALSPEQRRQQAAVAIDAKASHALFLSLERLSDARALPESSWIALPKALKNPVELEGMRQAHVRDGVALVKFLSWLEAELVEKHNTQLTEHTASEQLERFRQRQDRFVSLSFDTIMGCGANGAIIHYKPEPSTAAPVLPDTVILIDSGAQFRDGTTDVTRTVFFRSPASPGPSTHQRMCFTRVLQGHIALATAVFPRGTTGYQLDLLARTPLWKSGLDYRHGTGHGVGSFLNVHEGPHGISQRLGSTAVPLQEGMVVTNEPGYYEEGAFGIRIESVLVVRKADTQFQFGGTQFFCFDTITVAPLQLELIDFALLSEIEAQWVRAYNQQVVDTLSHHIDQQDVIQWLHHHTGLVQNS